MAGATQELPEGLGAMAPGPGLAFALAGIDQASVSGFDAVTAMVAARRQANAADAALLAWVVEVGLRDPSPEDPMRRMEEPDEWAHDEVRAALALTRIAANDLSDFATAVVVRLPDLHAAMHAGTLDEERARLFWKWTDDLSDAHARAVCAALLPNVDRLTTGQLRDRIAKHAIALDPGWARRRYEAGLREMKVVGRRNPDGTAVLVGQQMPPDRVAAACGRVDALARSAKHDGDPRPIDHVRSYLFLGMVDGTFGGLTELEILAHLAGTRPTPDIETSAGEAGVVPAAGREVQVRGGELVRREPPRIGVELQVRLSTLLRLDEFPADLAGYGPLHPAYARDLVADLGAAQWRYAVTGPDGHLITGGLTPVRPTGTRGRSYRSEAIVELQIPASLLGELLAGELSDRQQVDPEVVAAWAPVLADIARRIQTTNRPGAPPGDGTDDPTRRSPRAGLDRHVRMRRRRCIGIGCRAPVRTLQLDHTKDWAKGGPTIEANLAPACGHDHALKHKSGWSLRVINDHTYEWTTRLGRIYIVETPPVIEELPEPMREPTPPEPDLGHLGTPTPERDSDNRPWQESGSWHELPPGPEPPPAPEPPPRLPPELDIPPF